MTHEERVKLLAEQPGETISPKTLAKIVGGDPYLFNLSAKDGSLKLPHIWRGRNLRIFKAPLMKLLECGETQCFY